MATAPISVIIPHYNRSHLIGSAIESVCRQTLPPMEIIIVDDASDPVHRKALEEFRSVARIVYLDANIGPGRARNAGVKAAAGEFLAFLDDDDEWFPDKLQRQWEVIGNDQDLQAVAAPMTIRYPSGPDGVLRSHAREIISLRAALQGTPAMLQTLLIRAEALRQIGGFDSSFRVLSDREFWVRFTAAGCRARYMHEPVARLDRRHIRRFTSDHKRYLFLELNLIEKHADLYERTLGKGAVRRERSKVLRRHGSMFGGVDGRLRYLRGCLMAAEWKPLLHLFTTGQMMEVPYVRI
jgi:glycosyltransferase involved in cell wall biosynthesis